MRPYMPGLAISALSIGLLTALPGGGIPVLSPPTVRTGLWPPRAARPVAAISKSNRPTISSCHTTPGINSATFTGSAHQPHRRVAHRGRCSVELYRVFPLEFRSPGRPTSRHERTRRRMLHSPIETRRRGNLTFATRTVDASFTAANSVQAGGIHPKPSQTTQGDGQVTGTEVQFNVNFKTPSFCRPIITFSFRRSAWATASFCGCPLPDRSSRRARRSRRDLPISRVGSGSDLGARLATDRHRYRRPRHRRYHSAPTFNATFSLTGNHPRARVARAPRNSTLCNGPNGIAATPPVLTADDCQHSAGVCRKPIAGG